MLLVMILTTNSSLFLVHDRHYVMTLHQIYCQAWLSYCWFEQLTTVCYLLCIPYDFLCTLSCLAISFDCQSCGLSILNQRSNHSHNRYGLPSSPWVLAHLLLWHTVPLHIIPPPSPCWRMPHCFRKIFFLGPTIFGHVAIFPTIVGDAFKSLPLRVIVINLLH